MAAGAFFLFIPGPFFFLDYGPRSGAGKWPPKRWSHLEIMLRNLLTSFFSAPKRGSENGPNFGNAHSLKKAPPWGVSGSVFLAGCRLTWFQSTSGLFAAVVGHVLVSVAMG